MKMNKTLVALAVSAAVVAPFSAMADTALTGNFGMKLVMPSESDLYVGSHKARINVKNTQEVVSGLKVTAEVEADFDDAADAGADGSAIEVRVARMLASGGFGTILVAGKTVSGQQVALVGPVDIFEQGGASFFEQGSLTPNVAAYVSPKIAGGLNLVGAVIGTGTDNDEDVDAYAARAVWGSDALSAAVGMVGYSTDEVRTGLGLSTSFGPATVGFSYESTVDDGGNDGADKDVAGIALSMDAGSDMGLAVGYNTILSNDGVGTEPEDATAYQVLLTKGLGAATLWAEYDGYADTADGDYSEVALGMNYKF